MAKKKRQGRGRLSSIDLLPAKADEAVRWAVQELRDEERTQGAICDEFNEKLLELGLEPISSSAFNRHSIRLADMLRRTNRTREIASVLTERLEPGQSNDITIMLAEMIKSLISELLDGGGQAGWSPKQALELAGAVRSIVAAEKMSGEARVKLEAKVDAKMAKAVDRVSKEAGLSDELSEQIKAKFLGIRSE